MFTALLFSLAPAFAQDGLVSTDEEFDFLREGDENAELLAREGSVGGEDFDLYDAEEDDFGDFQLAVERAPEPAQRAASGRALPYAVAGKSPMVGNYEASVVHVDRDSVVVELPVLIGRSPADLQGSFWLIGEIHVDGMKVSESRQLITGASLAQAGPTVAFVKLQAPVPAASGDVELRVFKQAEGGSAEALFSKTVGYSL
jgi:hypothetical protein